MLAEEELRSNLDESDKVRDLQDKVADLTAEVFFLFNLIFLKIKAYLNEKKRIVGFYIIIRSFGFYFF